MLKYTLRLFSSGVVSLIPETTDLEIDAHKHLQVTDVKHPRNAFDKYLFEPNSFEDRFYSCYSKQFSLTYSISEKMEMIQIQVTRKQRLVGSDVIAWSRHVSKPKR